MKKTLLLLTVTCCVSTFSFAQNSLKSIKGIITDSVKNQPLGFVTVALQNAKTKQPVKSTLSKDNGSFEFNVPLKSYKLILASVGYKNKTINIDSAGAIINLGQILLSPASKDLKEVSVTAVRPIIKQEPDRISYDVQADPESKSISALDMLRKMPMVTVDATDNITLKGSSDYKILINNKPSALVARNPSDVFKAMPAANIERIEVITNPPAKYDAEGVAGIINIITKRNADQGYNGSISTRYNTVYGPSFGLNATVKQGKFGAVSYFGYSHNKKRTTFSDNEETFLQTGSMLNQTSQNISSGNNKYGLLELSYEIDTLNLLTAQLNYYLGNNSSDNQQISNQINAAGVPTQAFMLYDNGYDNWKGFDASLNYQLGFKRNKQQLLTFSYKYSYSPDKSFSDIDIQDIVDYNQPDYQQYNNSGNKEHTIQADYVHPLKKLDIEAGAKAILRNNFSDFYTNIFNEPTNEYATDPKQTNDFNYQQDVYSIYNSYQYKLSKWTLKGGLRLERTTVDANFISSNSIANQNYNNLIPNVSIQRMLKGSSISLGYTDRISRPGIWQLNPFVNRSNPRLVSAGNPDLTPVLYHSFSLNYSKFGKVNLNASLNYNFANNTIQSISTLLSDTVTLSSYQNIGKSRTLGLNLNISYPITKKLNVSLNSYTSYIKLTGIINSRMYSNDGVQANGFLNIGYKLSDTWRLGANGYAYTPFITLQGHGSSYISTSYNISKELLKKKMTVSFYASNPYSKYRTTKSEINSPPDFYQVSYNRNYYASYNFSINYRFGRLNSSIKKNQRGIENDDTASGGSKSGN